MTATDRWTIIIAALSLFFLIMSSGLALIVRITRRWTRVEENLDSIAKRIGELVRNEENDHHDLRNDIKDVNRRIERHEQWHDDHPYLKGS